MNNSLYPLFLKLDNRRVLIVGGGLIALQKLKGFLETKAKITVIAPRIIDEIKACRGEFPNFRKIEFFEREYAYGDELGAFIVIAATDSPDINNMIATRCRDQMILANSVDQPDYCDFYVPSIVEEGAIKIAISTDGKAPSIARRLREEIAGMVHKKYVYAIEFINNFRKRVQERISSDDEFPRRLKLINWFTERLFKKSQKPKLILVGAGPGDPEHLTLKALRLIQDADVVLYDNLVSEEILEFLFGFGLRRPELIYVGKKCSEKHNSQEQIHELILKKLSLAKTVVRLKGGDPFIFARGVEEMKLVREAGYECEVVPGLTSGLAVPVSLGIPLTLRQKSDSVMIVSAHDLNEEKILSWYAFLYSGATLLIYMGLHKLQEIRDSILSLESSDITAEYTNFTAESESLSSLPAILIQSGTSVDERALYSNLKAIPEEATQEEFKSPSLLILGKYIKDCL